MRKTAACIWGSENGSLKELRRGRRNEFTSSAQRNPFRKSNRAMHSEPQISPHEIPDSSAFSSSGFAMIHRLCRRIDFPDGWALIRFSSARLCGAKLPDASVSIGLPSTLHCRVKASLSGEDEVDLSTQLCTDQFIREKFSDKMP
jgi:hypothetical protein